MLRRELARKAFHMLSLAYLAAFRWLGWPAAGRWLAAWLALVWIVETARLLRPGLARALERPFEGLIRESERGHYSGIFYTTAGCLAAMLIAAGDSMIVGAALLQLALADAASALAGRAFGRVRLFGGPKSLEGALAGLAVGYAAALACGVRPAAAGASALAGALVELRANTRWFNDNLSIPIASAAVLRALGPR